MVECCRYISVHASLNLHHILSHDYNFYFDSLKICLFLYDGHNSFYLTLFACFTKTGTYQQTCIDGIGEAEEAFKSSVFNILKNSTEFTSNSLAIVTWLDKAASSVKLRRLLSTLPHKDEEPKWLNSKDRKMLEADDLKKKANIVVAKDSSGNFKTITSALKHVPEKSDKRTVIYVKKGIYTENVRVEKTKWNVMIIGDGMNATIVSGSLNFVDGTPTFSSATFGK